MRCAWLENLWSPKYSFNSLLEMRIAIYDNTIWVSETVSILYWRCPCSRAECMAAKSVAGFNSLLEMLRRLADAETSRRQLRPGFNSLLEMRLHADPRRNSYIRSQFQFSIGDAAKGAVAHPQPPAAVSILYWRCPRQVGRQHYRRPYDGFNSLLEMP